MTNNKINVGIIGCGVIGGVMKRWLEEHNSNCNVLCYDPPKNMNDDLSIADVVFISIHIPTEETGNIQTLFAGNYYMYCYLLSFLYHNDYQAAANLEIL